MKHFFAVQTDSQEPLTAEARNRIVEGLEGEFYCETGDDPLVSSNINQPDDTEIHIFKEG